ncbi:MAG: hypothetical protein EP332_14145 [Bacteroidetes bacterium]|nr:MAG: hypothetical protein EP332_14145 [Bacteroidota bacterium]
MNLTLFLYTQLVLSFVSHWPEPKGVFCFSGGFFAECIHFQEDHRFEYTSNSCTDMSEGKGTFRIEGDSLFLIFDSTKTDILEINKSSSDSNHILINIKVTDYQGIGIDFANVIIKNSEQKLVASSVTDSSGSSQISLLKDTVPYSFTVFSLGNEYSNAIVPDSNCSIKVNIDFSFFKKIGAPSVYSYHIKNLKRSRLELKKTFSNRHYYYQRKKD